MADVALPLAAVRDQYRAAVDLVVQVARHPTGRRGVVDVWEVPLPGDARRPSVGRRQGRPRPIRAPTPWRPGSTPDPPPVLEPVVCAWAASFRFQNGDGAAAMARRRARRRLAVPALGDRAIGRRPGRAVAGRLGSSAADVAWASGGRDSRARRSPRRPPAGSAWSAAGPVLGPARGPGRRGGIGWDPPRRRRSAGRPGSNASSPPCWRRWPAACGRARPSRSPCGRRRPRARRRPHDLAHVVLGRRRPGPVLRSRPSTAGPQRRPRPGVRLVVGALAVALSVRGRAGPGRGRRGADPAGASRGRGARSGPWPPRPGPRPSWSSLAPLAFARSGCPGRRAHGHLPVAHAGRAGLPGDRARPRRPRRLVDGPHRAVADVTVVLACLVRPDPGLASSRPSASAAPGCRTPGRRRPVGRRSTADWRCSRPGRGAWPLGRVARCSGSSSSPPVVARPPAGRPPGGGSATRWAVVDAVPRPPTCSPCPWGAG